MGMASYQSSLSSLPMTAIYGPEDKPLLSWRVHLLVWINAEKYYTLAQEFHLDEPWDSEHNKALIPRMPECYRLPGHDLGFKTPYLLATGKDTVYPDRHALNWKEIGDGEKNTILLVEVDPDRAVIWTKPEDYVLDPRQPKSGLGDIWPEGFHVLTAMQEPLLVSRDIDNDELLSLFTPNGAVTGRDVAVNLDRYRIHFETIVYGEEPSELLMEQVEPPHQTVAGHRPKKFATPAECFLALQRAERSKDIALILDCYTGGGQSIRAALIAFHVEREVFFQTEKQEAAAALLRRHGLEGVDIVGRLQEASMGAGPNEGQSLKLIGARIENKARFFADVFDLYPDDQNAPAPEEAPPAELLDVSIEGDRAVGIAASESGETAEIIFVKIDGGWRVDIPTSTPQ